MSKTPYGIKGSKTKLYIGTNTADLASESSWTLIGRLREISGTIGDTWKTADATTIDDDYERTMKTIRAGGDVDLTVLLDLADAGQQALTAAKNDATGAPYNFKAEFSDKPAGAASTPTTLKWEAHVTSAPLAGISPTRLVERKIKLDIQGPVTEQAKVTAA